MADICNRSDSNIKNLISERKRINLSLVWATDTKIWVNQWPAEHTDIFPTFPYTTSILLQSTLDCYPPNRIPVRIITVWYRFRKNASWVKMLTIIDMTLLPILFTIHSICLFPFFSIMFFSLLKDFYIYSKYLDILTLVLLNSDLSSLYKQCRSRSVGFCTVCHKVCKFASTAWIK